MDLDRDLIICRPNEVIEGLSPQHKWEVTRRHPYYLLFWRAASGVDAVPPNFREAASAMLMAIGVVGPPQPPSESAEELGITSQSGSWKEGAVSRVTVRTLVGILASPMLTTETKSKIVELISRSMEIDMRNPSHELSALIRDITQGSHPHFDQPLPDLIVTINPKAPGRAAASAVQDIIRTFKKDHRISERRRANVKIDDYLEVWDLREGWTGKGYDVSRELTLKAIARKLKDPISTIQSRYRSAFRYIVGHPYSGPLWLRVLGLPKLHGFFGKGLAQSALKRPLMARRRRDVPESVLHAPADPAQTRLVELVNSQRPVFPLVEEIDLSSDLQTLIKLGRSNSEIIAELKLHSERSNDLINFFRRRHVDRL